MVGFIADAATGNEYAGKHLLIDAWGCKPNLSADEILNALEVAAIATGATVLFKHAHPFEPQGSSGVIVLAESHVSFHEFPEEDNYIAIDIFVCGDCDPFNAIEVIQDKLNPREMNIKLEKRGMKPHNGG